jgi:hypothetical protein
MTATARKVLADCKTAPDLLEAESDTARFRVLWVSGVALLRSVGYGSGNLVCVGGLCVHTGLLGLPIQPALTARADGQL